MIDDILTKLFALFWLIVLATAVIVASAVAFIAWTTPK